MINKFKILACFTRSYDKHHDSNNLHLIASTILVKDKIDFNEFIENMRSNVSRKLIIVEVTDTLDQITNSENLLSEDIKFNKIIDHDSFGVIITSLNGLLKLYSSNETENIDYVRNLFNYNSETYLSQE
jgi:hypothetical protein